MAILGLEIALCPVSGRRGPCAEAFLRRVLRLTVLLTTPEPHDREWRLSTADDLIGKVLVEMEPLPTRMTTRSYELLMQAVVMVRYDARR